MNLNEYQDKARETAIYPKDKALEYTILGLVGEAGEVANKYKKHLRGDVGWPRTANDIIDELGDVLWYLSQIASELGYGLDEVAEENLKKLADRTERGVLKGSGDER